MTTREELADRIYREQYPDPTSPRIQPLAERAQWEQDMIYRMVDIAAEMWEAGAEAQCGQDNGGPMAVNPYTVPKPVPKTREEMSAFAKDWDAKVEASR